MGQLVGEKWENGIQSGKREITFGGVVINTVYPHIIFISMYGTQNEKIR